MTEWITQRQAAELRGCHVSRIPKLIEKGELTSRGRFGRASLDRGQVIGLEVCASNVNVTRRPARSSTKDGRTRPTPTTSG